MVGGKIQGKLSAKESLSSTTFPPNRQTDRHKERHRERGVHTDAKTFMEYGENSKKQLQKYILKTTPILKMKISKMSKPYTRKHEKQKQTGLIKS